ncbi:hypothetical protein EW146_g8386 [Bondarzewia mesenterica]|uniref:Uncharacterized protein n=1 Tax=Bondarzewia mesenterica TaxID=1095465 RepID=A0A4S4LGL1_9AGAM|nr:hypothetical protein EW146_g8386 [Bondarzewia mesenterica]
MTPDTDDLSSTFVPHPSRRYIPRKSSGSSSLPIHHESPHRGHSVEAGQSSMDAAGQPELLEALSSPDDGVKKGLEIDMKGLVGDAVGNMSISPSYRDVVLAARKGMFIIDLQAPLEVPRFLPQGGTWDVADVQWNPHPARAEYIVSTSSEKLLIWNLYLSGKTSIEHALHSHYRAITDINWHTKDPDVVVSTGIDSWLWAWDLRTPQKPVMGLCAFNAAGTQVKWNRQDGNVLASSHMNEVLIWDRRKGSIPVTRIEAHTAKIYGIDWAHNSSREIVTCSLDKTIKVWDVHDLAFPASAYCAPKDGSSDYTPQTVIRTTYPVWRARDLPFGKGVMSLPQRGETALEMWTHGPDQPDPTLPIEVFEGHTDVVKEFVWRRGGPDWNEFQLVTWSKDKTLRLWPVDAETMQRAGQPPGILAPPRVQGYGDNTASFRIPHAEVEPKPALSAPVGHRGILAEIRVVPPSRNPVLLNHHQSLTNRASASASNTVGRSAGSHRSYMTQTESEPEQTPTATSVPIPIAARHGGTMSKGNVGGKSARVDPFQWLSSVRMGEKARDGSSGTGSGQTSANASRIGSRSRQSSRDPPPGTGPAPFEFGAMGRRRSDSMGRREGEVEEQSLQDEITSVLSKLSSSNIKLEKHDLTKRRTCTLGLHGPWGESSSVFIRVSFVFPKDYPHGHHPEGTPSIELERTPLITMRNRAIMLRRLRSILQTRRPCLEACLRFLLFGNEDEHERPPIHIGFESSSDEDEDPMATRGRDHGVNPLQHDKNIAEPRTSQGVFGPNGQLICFNRAPPRIVRNPLHELSVSPSAPPQSNDTNAMPRLFQSPALLSDAVRRLTVASHDRNLSAPDSRRPEDGDSILHIMANLLTFSRQRQRRASEQSRQFDDIPASYSLLPTRLTTVFFKDASYAVNSGQEVAEEYVFEGPKDDPTPAGMCAVNSGVAKKHGRFDHERFFNSMSIVLSDQRSEQATNAKMGQKGLWGSNPLTFHLIMELYNELAQVKDIQMLAMLAVILLRIRHSLPARQAEKSLAVRVFSPPAISRAPSNDYFALRRRRDTFRGPPLSPLWARPASSPTANPISTSLSSLSSRGSWSSLFNTGSMRQLMAGVPESHTESSQLQTSQSNLEKETAAIPVPGGGGRKHIPSVTGSESPTPRRKQRGTGSPHLHSPVVKSWSEVSMTIGSTRVAPFGHAHAQTTLARNPTFSQVVGARTVTPAKKLVIDDYRDDIRKEQEKSMNVFEPWFLDRLIGHILVYAEMLFRWQLPHKRAELLKSIDRELQTPISPEFEAEQNRLGQLFFRIPES